MAKVVLHPTPTAQWRALIQEAVGMANTPLSEELESYLVFLLMRFTGESHLGSTVMALDFLRSLGKYNRERAEGLRDVGDKCLLFAGLFPELAKKRRVCIDYYVRLGRSAYDTLSAHEQKSLAELFAKLSTHFVPMMDVLHWIRSIGTSAQMDTIAAEELWRSTNSQYARHVLQQAIKHPLQVPFPIDLYKRH